MAKEIDNSEDVIDVRDIIARIEELELSLSAEIEIDSEEKPAQFAEYISLSELPEAQELQTLYVLMADLCGYGGDEQWRGDWYPITLVRDSYFTAFAEELVTDCGYLQKDLPSWIEIDWEKTARNVQVDYSSVELDGVTYWYR